MIRAVEGKASARTCTYDDVVALRDRAEKKLRGGGESGTALVISKAHLRGTIASYHAQVSCNSYGSYYASATVIQIIYDGEKWKFGLPSREEFSTININSENVYALRLSELAEQDVIARARAKYRKV
ncbi:MAG: hypothetical protein M0R66_01150 [Candidatus Omnitrophica bacterium]|nr:hypothetical protein [Candidatus Omnitrophota bacterium]